MLAVPYQNIIDRNIVLKWANDLVHSLSPSKIHVPRCLGTRNESIYSSMLPIILAITPRNSANITRPIL